MAVPKFFSFFVPMLKVLYDQSPMKVKVLRETVANEMKLSESDKAEMLPSGAQPTYANRVYWAIQYLKNAGLIEAVSRGEYAITEEGRKAYKNDGDKIDLKYLERYDSFLKFHHGTSNIKEKPISQTQSEDITPLESMEAANDAMRLELSKSLIKAIMDCSSDFFEHLVVDLLLAMGYGYDASTAGRVVGRTGDGGIDGIINEDKLGFSQVYVQAKRWDNEHTVGSPDVQAFAGALLGKGATKGLFITTGQFSNAARKYVVEQKTVKVVLVDGIELTRLMIDFGVGVSTQRTFQVKQLDSDYFEEA